MSCDCTETGCCSNVGITSTLVGGLINSLEICKTLKCKCCQITPDSKIFSAENFAKERLDALNFLTNNKLSFYIHCPLWCNLSIDADKDEKNTVAKSKGIVGSQLAQIADLPAACVLHVGTGGTIENVADRINSMSFVEGKYPKFEKQLLLEVAAGQGGQLGDNWNDIHKLFEAVDKPIGLCIDTQHIFGAGMTDWNGAESVVKLFDLAEENAKGIGLFHLNDSKVDFNSHVDRHASIGNGKIWYKNKESLKALLQRCEENDTNLVLETGGSQIKDIKFIKELMKK